MLKFLSKIFTKGNPIKDILDGVDSLSTSQEEKAEIRKSVVGTLVEAQASVLTAEYQHGTWLSRSWRPISALSFVSIIVYQLFLAPLFGLPVSEQIPPDLWAVIKLCLGGYIGLRTSEKLIQNVAPVLSGRQMLKKLKLELKAHQS